MKFPLHFKNRTILTKKYYFQWFLDNAEVYRYVPEAKRELQRMVFNTDSVKIDLESSKMIGEREHLLVLQSVSRRQSGEYKCQVADNDKDYIASTQSLCAGDDGHAPLSVHTILSLPQHHGVTRETPGHIR